MISNFLEAWTIHGVDWADILILITLPLIVGAFVASASGFLLWLSPEQKLLNFVFGFALMSSMTAAQLTFPANDLEMELLLYSLPLLASFSYFLPTIIAATSGSKTCHAVFLINLFAGWSVVGWVAALIKALHAEEDAETYDQELITARLALLTVGARTQIGWTGDSPR
jgi:hypothetical protein